MKLSSRIVSSVFVLSTVILLGAGCSRSFESSASDSPDYMTSPDYPAKTISRSDAIDQYWYQIARNVNGNASVQAYSSVSGSTYTLDADISGAYVDALHNGEGDTLTFTAEIREDGTASGTDQYGNTWEFTLDMNAPIVESAVQSWAGENGYVIE
ncbi:MAG: hypothetical protein WCO25_00155 [Candidatus Uhrbacteria bacterium]